MYDSRGGIANSSWKVECGPIHLLAELKWPLPNWITLGRPVERGDSSERREILLPSKKGWNKLFSMQEECCVVENCGRELHWANVLVSVVRPSPDLLIGSSFSFTWCLHPLPFLRGMTGDSVGSQTWHLSLITLQFKKVDHWLAASRTIVLETAHRGPVATEEVFSFVGDNSVTSCAPLPRPSLYFSQGGPGTRDVQCVFCVFQ